MEISGQLLVSILIAIVVFQSILGAVSYIILLERKVASWVQDRIGPNRTGLGFGILPMPNFKPIQFALGLGQPLADGVKMFFKEDYTPRHVDKTLFLLAPALALIPAVIAWAVIPWGGKFSMPDIVLPLQAYIGFDITIIGGYLTGAVADLNIGVVYILAVGSLAVYGVSIGSWASNNKYSFFGGLRATSQMLSYEIPMGIMVLCVLLMVGHANAELMVQAQAGYYSWGIFPEGNGVVDQYGLIPRWFVIQQPIACVLFFICSLAEAHRTPFDLAECEQELVGGYQTEYSSMKFALFPMAEYFHMITASAFITTLFLGGWHFPYADMAIDMVLGSFQYDNPVLYGILAFAVKFHIWILKIFLLLFLMILIRWTIPRFRFDQLMKLAWRSLVPLAIILLLMTGIFTFFKIQSWLWLGNIGLLVTLWVLYPYLPKGDNINKRVRFKDSRFSPTLD